MSVVREIQILQEEEDRVLTWAEKALDSGDLKTGNEFMQAVCVINDQKLAACEKLVEEKRRQNSGSIPLAVFEESLREVRETNKAAHEAQQVVEKRLA